MKELKIESTLYVFDSLQDVPQDIKNLMNHAIKARNKAYAPYSRFNVGAAILLDNDEIISGSNQENAAYPMCMCGEQVALCHAKMSYPTEKIEAMAITTSNEKNQEVSPSPCGSCRQIIKEYEYRQQSPIKIYLIGPPFIHSVDGVDELLPHSFTGEDLKS